jgi:hypothetical protein
LANSQLWNCHINSLMANQIRIFHIHISKMTSKSQYEKNLDAFAQWRNATAGGPPSIGHFWPPFAPLRRPPPPLVSVGVPFWESKNFSGHTPIFPKYEKNFPETHKNFPDIWYFSPKLKHFYGNNIDLSFQKCALDKKYNFNEIFSRRKKGTLQPKKGHLPKLGGAWPPRFLRPWLCLQRILNTNNICILLTIYKNPYQKSQKSQKCAIKFFMVIFVGGP